MPDFPFDMKENGILRLYNQFPRFYPGGIQEMTKQLESIKALGFNAVWINPIHKVGNKEVIRWFGSHQIKKIKVSGSLYSMFSETEFNTDFSIDEESLKTYVQTAKELELTPIFDLVINQVAADDDSPLIEKFDNFLLPASKKPGGWDDTRKFKYNDKYQSDQCIEKIFKELWEPFLEKYISNYGFLGVRVDAVKWIPAKMQKLIFDKINFLCENSFHCKAIILGELLDSEPTNYIEKLKSTGLTHITNNLVEADFSAGARSSNEETAELWKGDGGFAAKVPGKLRQIMYTLDTDALGIGGTVGYVSNHDQTSLIYDKKILLQNVPNDQIFFKLKERIWGVALSSDSGWYMLCGDEYGARLKPPFTYVVFKPTKAILQYVPKMFLNPSNSGQTGADKTDSGKKSYTERWEGEHDLRPWIWSINFILSKVSGARLYSYVEHFVYNQEISMVARHTKRYNEDSNETIELIVGNLSSKALTFDKRRESVKWAIDCIEHRLQKNIKEIYFVSVNGISVTRFKNKDDLSSYKCYNNLQSILESEGTILCRS